MRRKRFKQKETSPKIFLSLFLSILLIIVIGFLVFSNWRINERRSELGKRIFQLQQEIQFLEEIIYVCSKFLIKKELKKFFIL